jgi:hypothetical protein
MQDPGEIADVSNKTDENKLTHDRISFSALIGLDSPKLKKIKASN